MPTRHTLFSLVILASCLLVACGTTSKEPQVKAFGDQQFWVLTSDYTYSFPDTSLTVKIPKGFVTDFASIPDRLRPAFSEKSEKSNAAIVHDYLYWNQSCARKQADKIMERALADAGVGRIERGMIHSALRIGGRVAWMTNQRLRKEGLPRIVPGKYLDAIPENASWSEFRKYLRREGVRPEKEMTNRDADFCRLGD